MKIAVRTIIPLLILALGWISMKQFSKKEEAPRSSRRPENFPKVRVVELTRTSFPVSITSQGVARAHNSTSLTPRVSGQIHQIHPKFEEGAFFRAGEVLVELDSTDFQASIAAADARVARAEAALAQEEARAKQARLDWKDLGFVEEPGPLVLREPQLKQANADLAAAQADLSAAERDLERSKIIAPYDGCVLRRDVGPGQSVSPGSTLGEIFSTDYAEIRLPLTSDDLAFFDLPEEVPERTIEVTLFDALTGSAEKSWPATVIRTEGALDASSRKLFVIARVDDPYGLKSGRPPLRVGLPVRATIAGRVLENVYVLPRAGLRNPTEVLLVNPEDNTLQRTEIEPLWTDMDQIVVQSDLPEGWLLVVSQLSYPANGSRVEIVTDPPEGEGEGQEIEKIKAAQSPATKIGDGKKTGA